MKITAPNKAYTGVSASVRFVNGIGETDNPHLIQLFRQHGYIVEEDKKETKKALDKEPDDGMDAEPDEGLDVEPDDDTDKEPGGDMDMEPDEPEKPVPRTRNTHKK